jgi:hypothetical protein
VSIDLATWISIGVSVLLVGPFVAMAACWRIKRLIADYKASQELAGAQSVPVADLNAALAGIVCLGDAG